MKIVYVTNHEDAVLSEPKRAALNKHVKEKNLEAVAEVITVDFMDVRSALPISSAPCVFIMFDELTGDFPPERLTEVLDAVAKHFKSAV